MVWKISFTTLIPPLNASIFIMHMRNCVMGALPMVCSNILEASSTNSLDSDKTSLIWVHAVCVYTYISQ